MELTQHPADALPRMPLTYLRGEYPNHIMHLLNDDGDVLPPRELHPIFMAVLTGTRRYTATGCCCAACASTRNCRAGMTLSRCLPTISRQKRWRRSWPIQRAVPRLVRASVWLRLAAGTGPGAEIVIAAAGSRLVSDACANATDIRNRLVDYLSKLTYPIQVSIALQHRVCPRAGDRLRPGGGKITRWRVPFWRRRRGFISRIPSIRLTMNRGR